MRLIFLGSPEFAVPSLESIHESTHEVMAVVTQPDRPSGRKQHKTAPAVKLAAQRLNLPVWQPETTRDVSFLDRIASDPPDVLVVVAYGEILRRNLLDIVRAGAINLHASLLPKYRGAAPIAWAILNGDTETGATTMKINERMDAGDILLQTVCPIRPTDTTESLTKSISVLGAGLLTQTLDLLERKEIVPRPQDPAAATYAPKLKKEDGRIDWSRPADWIARQVRAFHPWPGTFTTWQGILVKIQAASALPDHTTEPIGVVLPASKHELRVACGQQTVLAIAFIQPQDRSPMPAADFINGYRVRAGSKLG